MSEKRSVPTFCLYVQSGPTVEEILEGPVVSPDKREIAQDLGQLNAIFRNHGAVLCYSGKWWYVPTHTLVRCCGGSRRFAMPWPLDEEHAEIELPGSSAL